jgi:hypothetical protein
MPDKDREHARIMARLEELEMKRRRLEVHLKKM